MRVITYLLLSTAVFAKPQLPDSVSLDTHATEIKKESSSLSQTMSTSSAKAAPTLQDLETRLDKALTSIVLKGPDLDMVFYAKARLHEAHTVLDPDPKHEEKAHWLKVCELAVDAALMQISTYQLQLQITDLNAARAKALNDLNSVHEEIIKVEQGNAASLRADLEEQKRKTKERQEEAEKRFSELNSALIQVTKDARGTIISMSDILFDVGKATLTADLKTNLAKISGILTIYKDANIAVEGHTDNQGSEDYNLKLSQKRASNVMDFMITQGIDAKRLTSAGFGFTKPIADNATKEGKQKNRRVDLVILDKKLPN